MMSEEWTEADDVIEEVWEIRRQIWERCGNDPEKVIAYYLELEKQHVGPRVAPPRREQRGESSHDAADEQDIGEIQTGCEPPATGE